MKPPNRLNSAAMTAIIFSLIAALTASLIAFPPKAVGQAGRQKTDTKQKKNPAATGDPEEERKQAEKKIDKSQPAPSISINTDLVNVEAVVFNKKTGSVIRGLTKDQFEIYEDGVKQDIENFATPEAPLTMVLVVEYSKLEIGRAHV